MALVTGGTRGIGSAVGRGLADEGASIAAGYWRGHEGAEKFQAAMSAEYPQQRCTLHEGNIGQANYAASKSGLFGLTKSLAREAIFQLNRAQRPPGDGMGVTVNAVTPYELRRTAGRYALVTIVQRRRPGHRRDLRTNVRR